MVISSYIDFGWKLLRWRYGLKSARDARIEVQAISPMPPINGDLPREALEQCRQFDTYTVSNAIERLNIRPCNEGFISYGVTCRFPRLEPVIGYAASARMRSSGTPVNGMYYYTHSEFWGYLASFKGPRIPVILDSDEEPGIGALVGEAYARISCTFGCVACIPNGAARALPGIEELGYRVFSRNVAVSHTYPHVADFGDPVEIRGWRIAGHAAARAEQVCREDRELFDLTERKDFSAAMLEGKLAEATKRNL